MLWGLVLARLGCCQKPCGFGPLVTPEGDAARERGSKCSEQRLATAVAAAASVHLFAVVLAGGAGARS